ncbi:phytoene desaturase, partial [Actinotalea ferrariae]|uniref:phytoene desaturase family protein n=1 Tax=Actinotalea ferrariae TaxID=1386098 RepID=UPI001C8B2ACE
MSADDRVVVVGAGIAGLATAALLAREGRAVTVLEARDVVGGRAGSWAADGFRFDTGPSWYLMPEVFDHFFRLLGTSAAEQLDLVRLDPGYRVYFERRGSMDVAADRDANVALFESIEPGAGAALEEYLATAEDTYAMALRHFLYTTFASLRPLANPEVAARLPRLAALLTRSLEQHVAARFRDPRLRQVLGYPAVFLGSAPRITPSMYHLMSRLDLADGVLYPQGGFARLVEAVHDLAVAGGAEIRTGVRVAGITTEPTTAEPGSASRGAGARAAAARAAGVRGR